MGDLSPFRATGQGRIHFQPRTHLNAARGISPIITGSTGQRALAVLDNRTHPLRGDAGNCPLLVHRVQNNIRRDPRRVLFGVASALQRRAAFHGAAKVVGGKDDCQAVFNPEPFQGWGDRAADRAEAFSFAPGLRVVHLDGGNVEAAERF